MCTSSICSIKSASLGNVMPQPLNLQMFIMKTAMSYKGDVLVNHKTVPFALFNVISQLKLKLIGIIFSKQYF